MLTIIIIPKVKDSKEAFAVGFLTYAIFDATNYAIFEDYNGYIGIIDAIWGGVMFAIVKGISTM